MMESWLQVSCDGCERDDAVSFAAHPNTSRAEYRAELRERGWRSRGSNDYCPACVVNRNRHFLNHTSQFDSGGNHE